MKLLEIALAEVGTKESPPNSNKVKYNTWIWGKEVSGAEYPWCGAFVSWCYDQAEISILHAGLTKGFVGCPYAVAHIKDWGKQVTVPEPGDVVFYDWNADKKYDHTGIFIKDIGNDTFESVEGNTALGNDSNGGAVMIRQRRYSNVIFVRPNSKV